MELLSNLSSSKKRSDPECSNLAFLTYVFCKNAKATKLEIFKVFLFCPSCLAFLQCLLIAEL